MSAIFGREDGMKIVIGERGGGEWKALHLTLKAELRGGRWQARLKRDFKRLR